MKNKEIYPIIKKDIVTFLSNEEGKINQKEISKIALKVIGLGIALATAMKADPTKAVCSHASHASHSSHGSHSSHASHGSHSSHSSHASHSAHSNHVSHASHSNHSSA